MVVIRWSIELEKRLGDVDRYMLGQTVRRVTEGQAQLYNAWFPLIAVPKQVQQ